MKNKIKQFEKGNFKLDRPDIYFSDTQVSISVSEGEIYHGEFTIYNRKKGNIRGLVYHSSFRVHCKEQGFDGDTVTIHYTFDSTGLTPGQMETGTFTIVCNGGEYQIWFSAFIEKIFIETEYGPVKSLLDLKKIAKIDFTEAKRVFRTRAFYDVIKYEDPRIVHLYDNMRKWSLDEQGLEEFLVAMKQKEKILLTLSDEELEFERILEDHRFKVEIEKNTWGHLDIQVETKGTFLEVRKKEFSTEDFVGNTYAISCVVFAERLHAGKNFGEILVKTPYETLKIDVIVNQSIVKNDLFGLAGMISGQILKEYLQCIAGKVNLNTWVEHALEGIGDLKELEPENERYTLYQAYVYCRGHKNEEAGWILNSAVSAKMMQDPLFIFLDAWIRNDSIHVNKALDELNKRYEKNKESWELPCMIMELDPRYRDYAKRISWLERLIAEGNHQVLLYAQAYICFQEKVVLLRKLGVFEIKILKFAAKYNLMTKELSIQTASLVCQQKSYDDRLVKIMIQAYQMYEEIEILQAICMQLIKGNQCTSDAFRWYELAVQKELKITQLYEYFMMSVNANRYRKAFPKIVYLYFLHGVNLDYKRTAVLYENIISYGETYPDIVQQYQERIKKYTKDQLLKRHVNDSLRVLYNRFLDTSTLTSEEVEALYDICHVYHICTNNTNMKYVMVIEKDGTIQQRVAYEGKKGANIYLYDKACRIVWEGQDGFHYADSIVYEARRLFYELRFIEFCKNRKKEERSKMELQEQIPVQLDSIRNYGMNVFPREEILYLCSKQIREMERKEDEFLIYCCYQLLKNGYYDKATLNYLSDFYCGATCDMKRIWSTARKYGVTSTKIAERIMAQMVYSETMLGEAEIFIDYHHGKPYFRLEHAYFAYAARDYVVRGREFDHRVMELMMAELKLKSLETDICKIAALKYYSEHAFQEEDEEWIQNWLREMCEKHLVFSWYMEYPKHWLRQIQLLDKTIVQYHSETNGIVKIKSQIISDEEKVVKEQTETMLPVYENIYVKEFVLFAGEQLKYSFQEYDKDRKIHTEVYSCRGKHEGTSIGRYGRINAMVNLTKEKRQQAMLEYKKEENIAEQIFEIY